MKSKTFSFLLPIFIIIFNIVTCSCVFAAISQISVSTSRDSVGNNKPYYWPGDDNVYQKNNSQSDGSADVEYSDEIWVDYGNGKWRFWDSGQWFGGGEIEDGSKVYFANDNGYMVTGEYEGYIYNSNGTRREISDTSTEDNSGESEDNENGIGDENETSFEYNNSNISFNNQNNSSNYSNSSTGTYDDHTPRSNQPSYTFSGGISPVTPLNKLPYLSDADDQSQFPLPGIYVDIDPTDVHYGGNIYLSTSNTDLFKTLLLDLKYKPEGVEQISNFIEELKKLVELVNLSFAGATKFYQTKELTEARVQRNRIYQENKLAQYFLIALRYIGIALILIAFTELVLGIVEASGYAGSFVLKVLGGYDSTQDETLTLFGFRLALVKHVALLAIIGVIMLNPAWIEGIVRLVFNGLKFIAEKFHINDTFIDKLKV